MTRLRDLSINKKLTAIIMVTSATAVFLACAAFLIYDRIAFQEAMVRDLRTLSEIIGANSTAALLFDNAEDATETLASLAAESHIIAAAIYTLDNQVFATYNREKTPFSPPEPRDQGHQFAAGHLDLFGPVKLDEEQIGHLFIRSDLQEMRVRQTQYLILVGIFLVTASLIALLITARLQHIISGPILKLAELARAVSQRRDYTVRAYKDNEDEVGVLIDAFNDMLTQIQEREAALHQANEALESRVTDRTRDLQAANTQLIREIEEREQAERVLLEREEQLRQSQKMEAIGKLAGGVAHDFNNQLAVVQGYIDMVMADLPEDSRARGRLLQVSKAVLRSTDLTQQLLMFSSRQPIQMRPIDLNQHVRELKDMLERLMGEDVEILLNLDEDLWTVQGDPGNIGQVVTNLCVNARDAMPGGGAITIQTRMIEIDAVYCQQVSDAHPGIFAVLSVSDTGTGIEPEIVDRLFEPFFSTKGPGKGTGLGLSVVYGIAQSHGGWITVHSELGKGSRFDIFLEPAEERHSEESDHFGNGQRDSLQGHGEHILLVEDEPMLGEMTREMLINRNYKVDLCNNISDARTTFEQATASFDLVLSDVVLPDGRGPDLVLDLLQQHPNLSALLVTGYTDERSDRERVQKAGLVLLQKPVPMEELLVQIRQALTQN